MCRKDTGSATIQVAGRDYRLEGFTPGAHLHDVWCDAWVDAVANSGVRLVTTIELVVLPGQPEEAGLALSNKHTMG